MSKRVLFVVTSHEHLGNTGKKTGYWLGEVAHPHKVLTEAGCIVDFASPQGGAPPIDRGSFDLGDADNAKFVRHEPSMRKLSNSQRLLLVDAERYDAVLFVGGHGTCFDFVNDVQVHRIARRIYERGGIVAAVCHGPTALLNVKMRDGNPLIKGRAVTGFSNDEEATISVQVGEKSVPMSSVIGYSLEDELTSRGAEYRKAQALFGHNVVVDGQIITGQNPASARAIGEAIEAALNG